MPQSHDIAHGMAPIHPSLRLHYVSAGTGERTIVLLHGFPQTWWEWRHVIPTLAEAGFRVIAPDYRGAGNSSRPIDGYDKRTLANDIRLLLQEHLKIEQKVIMVGHDIGLMVAYAYAELYRDAVSHLVVMDAPLPGTALFDKIRLDPRVWHFAYHAPSTRSVRCDQQYRPPNQGDDAGSSGRCHGPLHPERSTLDCRGESPGIRQRTARFSRKRENSVGRGLSGHAYRVSSIRGASPSSYARRRNQWARNHTGELFCFKGSLRSGSTKHGSQCLPVPHFYFCLSPLDNLHDGGFKRTP